MLAHRVDADPLAILRCEGASAPDTQKVSEAVITGICQRLCHSRRGWHIVDDTLRGAKARDLRFRVLARDLLRMEPKHTPRHGKRA